jgi:cysteinyl-tRNA synthetase
MSKSLGNFFTARDVLNKYSAEAIRLFFAQAYYRGPLDFNDELLTGAKKGLEKFSNLIEVVESEIKKANASNNIPDFDFNVYKQKFSDSMDDDFNTAQAVAVIFDFVRDVNRTIAENNNIDVQFYKDVKEFLSETAEGVLGIIDFSFVKNGTSFGLEDSLINILIELRLKARSEKNFKLSDEIRNRLGELGVILKDTKEGTTFKKT